MICCKIWSIDSALAVCSRWLVLAGNPSTIVEINVYDDSCRSRESVTSEYKGAWESASAMTKALPGT